MPCLGKLRILKEYTPYPMIITEQDLSPYRKATRLATIHSASPAQRPTIPSSFFGTSLAELAPGWTTPVNPPADLQIVLALAFVRAVPVLQPGRQWVALTHQCGGYSCEQLSMIATNLSPRPALWPVLKEITREGFAAENGHFYHGSILASRIAAYVGRLKKLNLDCEATWPLLTESVYPIDATQENLNRIAQDAPDLDSIADWTDYPRARYNPNLAILLLTENSD